MTDKLATPNWISQQTIQVRNNRVAAAQRLPYLSLVVGTDLVSAGLCAWVTLPTGGQHPRVQGLVTSRWQYEPTTTEDLVRIAVRGLQAYGRQEGMELT